MTSNSYVLQDLERTIKENSRLYEVELQKDLRQVFRQYHWDEDTVRVESLRSASPRDPIANYFFPVKDNFTILPAGYIFPFRKLAVADRSPFVEAFAQVLLPQGYEVLRYAHHRGLPDIRYLVELVKHNNSPKFQVVRSSEQLSF